LQENDAGKKITAEISDRLVRYFLDLIILSELRNQPMFATDMQKAVERDYGFQLSTYAYYNMLHSMLVNGLKQRKHIQTKKEDTYLPTKEISS
jgi:DNA-binding PadR family transcriptional regulator